MRSDLVALIDTDSLVHNFNALRDCCRPGLKLCAPLKADAYGHGLRVVAPVLQKVGADYAAVANIREAIELRDTGWTNPILVLGNVLAIADENERRERLSAAAEYDLTLTIVDIDAVRTIIRLEPKKPIPVHLKVDTGMGRMGAMPDDFENLLVSILATKYLRLKGVYSHFATADFGQRDLVATQLKRFKEITRNTALPADILLHMANSAATISLPDAHFDMVRPGLALYGYLPADHMKSKIDLRPALRLVSHVAAIKILPPGHCVGYGQTFTTKRETRLGIIPLGYSDGFVRALSNQASVGTAGGDAPVIGRVSMDQLAIDLTDCRKVGLGDPITLIDPDPARPNSVAALARRLNTIPYEVTCLLGNRIDRLPQTSYRTRTPPVALVS